MGLLSLGKVQLPTRGGFSFATVKYPTLGELQKNCASVAGSIGDGGAGDEARRRPLRTVGGEAVPLI